MKKYLNKTKRRIESKISNYLSSSRGYSLSGFYKGLKYRIHIDKYCTFVFPLKKIEYYTIEVYDGEDYILYREKYDKGSSIYKSLNKKDDYKAFIDILSLKTDYKVYSTTI